MDLFSFPFNLSTCFWSYAQAFIRFMEKTKLLETKGLIVSKLDPIRIFFNTVLYIQMKSDYEIDKNFSCKKLESLKSTLRLTHGSKKFLFNTTESESRMHQISQGRDGQQLTRQSLIPKNESPLVLSTRAPFDSPDLF